MPLPLRARTQKMRAIFRAGRFAIAYVPRLRHSGSTLRPCTQNLLAHILRQGLRGGVRSRWSLTSTLRAIKAKRPLPPTASPSVSP